MDILKKIIFLVLLISNSVVTYATISQSCIEQASFDTQSGLLSIPCLRVDNGNFYEVTMEQKTSSTFVLTTYNDLGGGFDNNPGSEGFWDKTSEFLSYLGGFVGIGTDTPQAHLDVNGGIRIGDFTLCDSDHEGTLRYNAGAKKIEYCDGNVWSSISTPAQAPVNHYYGSIAMAKNDGLVQYLPLNEGTGASLTDYGSANSGASYPHGGGQWVSTTVDAKYGSLLRLTRAGGVINPAPDPTAVTEEYTILVILPGRDIDNEFSGLNNMELIHINKQNIIHCNQQTYMNVFFDDTTDHYQSRMMTNCNTPTYLDVPRSVAENNDGVVYAFFSYDGATYRYQLGNSNEQLVVRGVHANNQYALYIGGGCSGGNCSDQANALIYSYAMWNRVLSSAEKNAIIASGSELVNGFVN